MTQEERALCGKLFDAHSPELMTVKHRAHSLCREYNGLSEEDPRRLEIIRELLQKAGDGVYFQGPVFFNYGRHTKIGHTFYANVNFTVLDDGEITIGDHVMIGPNVSLVASSHPLLSAERESLRYPDGHVSMSEYGPKITIGSHVWLACNVTVCGGVTIGDGAVIGAGSVVVKDIPAGWLAYGNPCKPIRPITEADSKQSLL